MRSKFLLLIILIVSFFLFESCTSYIYYSVATPPAIQTSEPNNSIGFVNKYDYSSLTFENARKTEVYVNAVKTLIANLERSFTVDEHFNFTILDSLIQGLALEDFPDFLNEGDVIARCESGNVDMLLVLEFFNPYFITETEVEENEDGGKSRTNYVDLFLEAGITLYDQSGEILDRLKITESQFYQTRAALSSFIVIGPSMKKADEEINSLAKKIGENYVRNFYPGTETEKALIHIGKAFREVTPQMVTQNWSGAIEILLPLANSADPKIAKKARHNLAMAYKAMGDHESYDYWIRKSRE